MDRQLVETKIELLRRAVSRAAERCPDSQAVLESDLDTQDILVLNLTRSVQLCVDIAAHIIAGSDEPAPETMGGAFDTLAKLGYVSPQLAAGLKKAVGFRNIAVHNYDAINWAIVLDICQHRLADFRDFAAATSRHLEP